MAEKTMKKGMFATHWFVAILLLIFFGSALYLRVGLAYDRIFVDGIVKFTAVQVSLTGKSQPHNPS